MTIRQEKMFSSLNIFSPIGEDDIEEEDDDEESHFFSPEIC